MCICRAVTGSWLFITVTANSLFLLLPQGAKHSRPVDQMQLCPLVLGAAATITHASNENIIIFVSIYTWVCQQGSYPIRPQSALTTDDCECERWRAAVSSDKESFVWESSSNLCPLPLDMFLVLWTYIFCDKEEVKESLTGGDVSGRWNTRQILLIRLEMSCPPVEVTSPRLKKITPPDNFRCTSAEAHLRITGSINLSPGTLH